MDELVAVLAGVSVFGLIVGSWLFLTAPLGPSAVELLRDEATGAIVSRQRESTLRKVLPPPLPFLVARADLAALDQRLANAGRPSDLTAVEYIRLKTLAAGLIATLVVLITLESGPVVYALFGLAAAAAGYRLPDVWLSGRVAAVEREIDRQLPDMVDSLVLALDAGMDLEAALRRLVPKLKGAIRDEWDQVIAELEAGFSLNQSLQRLQGRARSKELGELVSLMQQARRLGVGLSGALRQRAEEMRTRRRLRASEAAQRAPLKMTIPLVLFFLPALMIVFLGPAILSFIGGS
jgi:tight adherence protein C